MLAGFAQRVRRLQTVRTSDVSLVVLVILIGVVGILTAGAVLLFERTVDWLLEMGYDLFPERLHQLGLPPWLAFVLYPVILGLTVALFKWLVPTRDRRHSVPLVMISMARENGRIRPLSTLLKTLGSLLTLGAGGSLGREGPVVLLGGGLGSALGQALRLEPEWRNTLIAAGAGAAIATAFHAPITGTLFVMEIVLIQFSSRSFALVALASVTATEFSRLLEGVPPFPIPAYQIHSPWEIPLYLLLGLFIAPIARAYVRVLYGSEHLGSRLHLPDWLKPALGGILFGVVALVLPRTLGGGYNTISDALIGRLSLGTLLILLVAKLLTIGITSGSGWPGGVFTPALFLGSMAGGAFGIVANAVFPQLAISPGAFAVVGMSAMIAGATHAPLTAMTLIFEVTRDYRIALPAMVACGIAAVFSQRMSPYSVDTVHLSESGVLLPWQVHDLRSIRVDQCMTRELHTVHTGMVLKDVIEVMQKRRHGGYPVLGPEGRLVGMITLRDIREVPLEKRLTTPVATVMKRDVKVIEPDESLAAAALIMARSGLGRLPVVDPEEPARLLGIISRTDILRMYPGEAEPAEEGTTAWPFTER